MQLKIKKISPDAKIPQYACPGDAGLDLFSAIDCIIGPGESQLVKTGIVIELPVNTEGQIRPRSGLALKHQITVLNSPGTIDEGYRGEIGIILINHGKTEFSISKGMKIAQLVIKPTISVEVIVAENLSDSIRGEKGFGDSGNT